MIISDFLFNGLVFVNIENVINDIIRVLLKKDIDVNVVYWLNWGVLKKI